MLGHRTLNVEDYLTILKRRWWILAIPIILCPIAGFIITYFITPQYVSQTLVLVQQQTVPSDYVKPVVSESLDSRLSSMQQQIESRSSIQPIIEKYKLYAGQHLDMDDRVDLVRNNIRIQLIHSDIPNSGGLPGFYIDFKDSDPRVAQQVCGEIESLFTGDNQRSREAAAEGTTQFLKEQLDGAKRNLDDQDSKLAAFQQKYFGMLPSDQSNNVNLLGSLNTQLEAATQGLSQLQTQKSYIEAMLASQLSQPGATSPSGTQRSEQDQSAQLQSLLAQQADLTARYQPDYPDVIAVNRKIADLRKQMAQTAAEEAAAPAAPSLAPNRNDSASVQQLRAEVHAADVAIQAKRRQQAQLEQQVRTYQGRIQSTPGVEEQYKELTRNYTTAQAFYDSLLSKMNSSQMATDLERRMEGEQFNVMDAPNLPDSPDYPKRMVFVLGGLAAGISIGFIIVALLEYKDTALRTERDIWAFTQLPTLAVIAWSGEVAEQPTGTLARLKRLFGRKKSKEMLADAPG